MNTEERMRTTESKEGSQVNKQIFHTEPKSTNESECITAQWSPYGEVTCGIKTDTQTKGG